jgi:hypothetical protein
MGIGHFAERRREGREYVLTVLANFRSSGEVLAYDGHLIRWDGCCDTVSAFSRRKEMGLGCCERRS